MWKSGFGAPAKVLGQDEGTWAVYEEQDNTMPCPEIVSHLQDLGRCLTLSLCCTKTSLGSYSSNSEMVVETEDRNSGFNIHILKAEPIGFTEEPKL